MGCDCSCPERTQELCDSGEFPPLMPQPGTVPNYESTSSDGTPRLPPLPRVARRAFPHSQQQHDASSTSGASSPAKSGEQVSKSQQRPPPSAAIPIGDPAQPGPSREPLAGSPQPSTSSSFGHAQPLGVPFVRALQLSPRGLAYIKPKMATIIE